MTYTYDAPFPIQDYARNRVQMGNMFRDNVIRQYIALYEEFWGIHRDDVDMAVMQSILDELKLTAITMLQNAVPYVTGIVQGYPEMLPEKYHQAPYTYQIVTENGVPRLVLTGVAEAWIPELAPTEPEEGESP